MKRIGVIGAGVMGCGVALSFAIKGFEVILVDISNDILKKASDNITSNLRMLAFNKKDLGDHKTILKNIQFTLNEQLLDNVDFIVENIPEKIDIKKNVIQMIDKICSKETIFMHNTSCISITKLASFGKREDKVIGVHFMNPVPMIKGIELIKGFSTSEKTVLCVKELVKEIGKESIVVNDYPGFVSNRISHLMMNEAAFIIQDQVATAEQIDQIFKKCYGHKMGPLETADLIGLDTVVNSLDVLYESYQDPKFRCSPLLRKMVDAGLQGAKNGKGFYQYNID